MRVTRALFGVAAACMVVSACSSSSAPASSAASSTARVSAVPSTSHIEPSGTCAAGAPRLAGEAWVCDPDHTAVVIPSPATIYYVDNQHPNASDASTGTDENAPWATIVHAAKTLQAGETVQVKAGTYDDGEILVANSGERGAPIVIEAYPGQELGARIINKGVKAVGRSHIVIRGLGFESVPKGIAISGPLDPTDPPAENIAIIGNRTRNTESSGISVWGVLWGEDPGEYDNVRDVIIESNTIELANTKLGGEFITVANGVENADVRFNTLRHGAGVSHSGEGIDFKEGVRNSRIHANTIYGLTSTAIYIDGGRGPGNPVTSNIEISQNTIRDVGGNGVSISTEGPGDVHTVLVHGNIVTAAEFDGILVYLHPEASPPGDVDDVLISNNTVVESGRPRRWGGISIANPTATVMVLNNIAWDNAHFDIRNVADNPNVDIAANNLCSEEELCSIVTDPQLDNHFSPTPDSPAIDAGISWIEANDLNGTPMPQGSGWDLGAVEAPAS